MFTRTIKIVNLIMNLVNKHDDCKRGWNSDKCLLKCNATGIIHQNLT